MARNKTGKAGVALAAAAAAVAAGYYFYASKNAKKHRRIAASWARGLKNEVVRRAKKAEDLDRKTVLGIVDKAVSAYAIAKTVDRRELSRAAKELKDNWQLLVRELTPAKKAPRKRAKKR